MHWRYLVFSLTVVTFLAPVEHRNTVADGHGMAQACTRRSATGARSSGTAERSHSARRRSKERR